MRILNSQEQKNKAMAMLIELSLDYSKLENQAHNKRDFGKIKEYIELKDYIDKLIENIVEH